MPRYIDAEKLYEQFAELEAMALAKIENLNMIPLEEMTKEEYVEWRVWSAILVERSAFKHDVFDAPTADVQAVKYGKWLVIENDEDELWQGGGHYECSVCGWGFSFGGYHEMDEQPYCPHCGAKMEVPDEEPT